MLSKFGNQSAQKQFIFSNKANFERGLIKAPEIFDNIFKLLLKKWRKKDLLIKILNRRQALKEEILLYLFN